MTLIVVGAPLWFRDWDTDSERLKHPGLGQLLFSFLSFPVISLMLLSKKAPKENVKNPKNVNLPWENLWGHQNQQTLSLGNIQSFQNVMTI